MIVFPAPVRRSAPWPVTAAALAALAIPGCGGPEGSPPPLAPAPPLVARVEPAARAVRVAIDTPIWAEFTEALDPATVNAANVVLLIDTRRVPAAVAWDAAARRIRVTPAAPLELRRTHTVQLGEGLRTASGARLTGGWFWQFTTISVRIPDSPQPLDGARDESPFVLLRWKGLTGAEAGPVEYRLRMAADSATALDPRTPPLAVVQTGRFLTRTRWDRAGINWWSVEAFNLETGDRLTGPAWRFECLPADAPVDTVDVGPGDYAWFNAIRNNRSCMGDSVVSGTALTAAIRWTLPVDSTRKLAGAAIELLPFAHSRTAVNEGASVWLASSNWGFCEVSYPTPPFTDEVSGKLAETASLTGDRVRFASDALTAHVEAMGRVGGYYGYVFRSAGRMTYWSPLAGRGRMRIAVYRTPAAAATSPLAARAPRGAGPAAPGASRRNTARRR